MKNHPDHPNPLRRHDPQASLDVSLQAWVPMRMRELRHLSEQALCRLAVECARRVTTNGDSLMLPGKSRTADAWAELVTGLAALALTSPDGVTWRGQHWCAHPHDGCPRSPGPVTDPRPGGANGRRPALKAVPPAGSNPAPGTPATTTDHGDTHA